MPILCEPFMYIFMCKHSAFQMYTYIRWFLCHLSKADYLLDMNSVA